jgi:hypothetical protein
MANIAQQFPGIDTTKISPETLESLKLQKAIQAQSAADSIAQTTFQDQKNKQNEALKALSDAVKDASTRRNEEIRNMKMG